MKLIAVSLALLATAGLFVSTAFAGDAVRGKRLFNDPAWAGASGTSCSTCHPGGKGLETSAKLGGKTVAGLEEAVNVCRQHRTKGKALAPTSADMEDIVAYIRSLQNGTRVPAPAKRPAATGC